MHLVGCLYYWQMGFNSVFKGLRQRIIPECSKFKAEINKYAKIPDKRPFFPSKHQELSVLCDTQRYRRECVTHFCNRAVNIVLICRISYSYCSDCTFGNNSITAIKFCSTKNRIESFNVEFEVSLWNLGNAVAQWLRCYATNREVAGSIPDAVKGTFHWYNPSDRTMTLWSTQPLTEMSTRSIFWG